jgi:hypothetical protein
MAFTTTAETKISTCSPHRERPNRLHQRTNELNQRLEVARFPAILKRIEEMN